MLNFGGVYPLFTLQMTWGLSGDGFRTIIRYVRNFWEVTTPWKFEEWIPKTMIWKVTYFGYLISIYVEFQGQSSWPFWIKDVCYLGCYGKSSVVRFGVESISGVAYDWPTLDNLCFAEDCDIKFPKKDVLRRQGMFQKLWILIVTFG